MKDAGTIAMKRHSSPNTPNNIRRNTLVNHLKDTGNKDRQNVFDSQAGLKCHLDHYKSSD